MIYRSGITATLLLTFAAAAYLLTPAPPAEPVLAASAETDPAPYSHGGYGQLLRKHVDENGLVDYAALKKDRAPLDAYAAALARLDPATYAKWSEKEKLALWINAYNALTLIAILDHYPIQPGGFLAMRFPKNSIRQIPGVWDKLSWTILGKPRTLEEIEHKILRKQFNDPRIHMAIVCASIGCPYLRNEAYSADQLDAQLEDQSKRFLAAPGKFHIDRAAKKVYISPIFDWFGEDFLGKYATAAFGKQGKEQTAVLNFIGQHIPPQDRAYLETGAYAVKTLDYDWSLNEQ